MKPIKMLQLYAKDIYANTRFDENGNKSNEYLAYEIDLTDKKNSNALSGFFRGTMSENLDLDELCNSYGKKNIIKYLNNTPYLTSFITVIFEGKSTEYFSRRDYTDNKLVYIERGFRNFKEVLDNLKDSVYIKDGKLIAVKIENDIENENKIVTDSKYFKLVEKDNKQQYLYSQSSVGDVSSKELRKMFYEDGFSIRINDEIIKYVRYKRSASNARVGKCLFIDNNYFEHMNNWSFLFNQELKNDEIVNSKPVEIEAYKALSLSSLKNKIKLNPQNVLLLRDIHSLFDEDCINVTAEDGKLHASKEKTPIENNIWDGEGLLDVSVFKENGYEDKGMLLLRNKFFKCCAFNTNLQQWFKDNNITKLNSLNGWTQANSIEDIKLVITESSLKILKFSDSQKFGYSDLKELIDLLVCNTWMDNTEDIFGVVKTDEPTHWFDGKVVQASYQLLNTLGMSKEEVKELIEPSQHFLDEMKDKSSVLQLYLKRGDQVDDISDVSDVDLNNDDVEVSNNNNELENDSNNFRYIITKKLLDINNNFGNTVIYSEFRKDILAGIKAKYKTGKILIPGTYATIFGNGYELLQNTIGDGFDINNTKPLLQKGEIMCKRYKDGEKLCAARFPHITMGNLYLATNTLKEEYDKYFNLSSEIVCVNAIGENLQQKLNGMDYDSDTMLITNFKPIVDAVAKNYDKFLVPVCSVASEKGKKVQPLYEIDHKIANNYTGRIVNLSQRLNSIIWDIYNNDNQRIDDDTYLNICKLAVLSGMEIDKAKRDYNVNSLKEFNEIENWLKDTKYKDLPLFMSKKKISKEEKIKYETIMNYIYLEEFNTGGRGTKKAKLSSLISPTDDKIEESDIQTIIRHLQICSKKINNKEKYYNLKMKNENDDYTKYLYSIDKNIKVKEELKKLFDYDSPLLTNSNTVKKVLEEVNNDNHAWPLLYVLMMKEATNKKYANMLEEIFTSKKPPKKLVYDDNGNIELFGIKYSEK